MTQRAEMEPLLSGDSADLAEIGVGDAADVHVHVTFRSIYFRVVTREDTTLEILKNVSGHCLPGRVLSIMGPSGAGKTTLVGVRGHRLIVHRWRCSPCGFGPRAFDSSNYYPTAFRLAEVAP